MPAMEVFSKALRYLGDVLLRFIHDTEVIEIEDTDIQWVLTVPAIWRPGARHFMRKAAYEVIALQICEWQHIHSRRLIMPTPNCDHAMVTELYE